MSEFEAIYFAEHPLVLVLSLMYCESINKLEHLFVLSFSVCVVDLNRIKNVEESCSQCFRCQYCDSGQTNNFLDWFRLIPVKSFPRLETEFDLLFAKNVLFIHFYTKYGQSRP